MKPVISPLKVGDHGADVANLQGALLLLSGKDIIQFSAAGLNRTLKDLSPLDAVQNGQKPMVA
ncbi:hypothetical protein [Ktedonobacter robiniae]|uniref:Uncharacterized protein n=1 Tax=Ktedonobacter robiniae TaxID=2778365 RepID=A0ABQ3UU00_9CHLR|nr:hypothetical protein [Ktedonobacter robiniae]GHO56152.1 hypothetical protein KSB_46270 [Ktedonobacter robiniae]